MAYQRPDTDDEDGWPWNCARCGTTIFHDAVCCESCEQRSRGIRDTSSSATEAASYLGAWFEWIDQQSYPSLVAKSSGIAGIEVLLTAVWLRILFLGSLALPSGVPV